MRRTLIIFSFWGSGNMGDDLMMAGFLGGLNELNVPYEGKLSSLCSHRASQKLRFPGVQWIDPADPSNNRAALAQAEAVVGIGDTPFQLTSGDWSLQHMQRVFKDIRPNVEAVLINVGAENEILPRAVEFAAVLRRVSRCSARDSFSHSILARLSPPPKRSMRRFRDVLARLLPAWNRPMATLFTGGDLANISLKTLSETVNPQKTFSLGVVLGHDTLSEQDLNAVRLFLDEVSTPTAFILGDYRDADGFEYRLYREWTQIKPALTRKLILRRPDYTLCSLADLVQPFAECEVILSSRLHGLLTAAWMGCRVAALGRSSKVIALAEELDIPCVKRPFQVADIRAAAKAAVTVPRERLMQQREKCLVGIMNCKFW